jgi:hypothetical protein
MFLSISPVPWSVFEMDFWGCDGKHGHRMPIIDMFGQARKQEKRCEPSIPEGVFTLELIRRGKTSW